MWLCDVLFLLFVTTSSGLLVTEIPESELNVSCRLRPELVWILQLGAVADDIEALLLAGVAGDKMESFLGARLLTEAGRDIFARTPFELSRRFGCELTSMLLGPI